MKAIFCFIALLASCRKRNSTFVALFQIFVVSLPLIVGIKEADIHYYIIVENLMRHGFAIIILFSFIVFVSCTGNMVYDHYEHTPVAGWDKVDVLSYDVPALQDSGRYSISLGLRINDVYPFQGLTLIVEQEVIPVSTVKGKNGTRKIIGKPRTYTNTLNCELFDRKGTVKGQGISYYQYHFRVSELDLNKDDSLHITVRHGMKREIMPGIADVGISVSK